MADNPKEFRYDSAPHHKTPPKGLKPSVNKPKKKAKLTPEQEERRKKLLSEMKDVIAKQEEEEQKQPTIDESHLPYDVEDHHPAEDVKEEGDISKYKIDLATALETPRMKSIRFGVVGTGQCGGRLAEQFSRFGYQVCVINTAEQDLAYLDIPDERKLLMKYALGGAGRNLLVGQQAAAENSESIKQLLEKSFDDIDQVLICIGGGGGTGGGSVVPLLESIMQTESITGLPIVVIYTLPMDDEGAASKSNAVKTLERIAAMVNDDLISSLIIVDNAKIQEHYPDVSVKDFWKLANFDIVNHFNMFNTVSKCATNYDALDPMDFANIVSTGGCLIYGRVEIPLEKQDGQVLLDEGLLANALIKGIQEGTLAEGFDVTQSVGIGVIITSSDQNLSQIPAVNVNFAFNVLSENVGEDCSIYRGMYANEYEKDSLTVYTIFSGLGLPAKRISKLKEEAAQALEKIESKKKVKLSMSDDGKQTQEDPYAQIRQRNTSMGRMIQRRRRSR